jgi:hypothetical protein
MHQGELLNSALIQLMRDDSSSNHHQAPIPTRIKCAAQAFRHYALMPYFVGSTVYDCAVIQSGPLFTASQRR